MLSKGTLNNLETRLKTAPDTPTAASSADPKQHDRVSWTIGFLGDLTNAVQISYQSIETK